MCFALDDFFTAFCVEPDVDALVSGCSGQFGAKTRSPKDDCKFGLKLLAR